MRTVQVGIPEVDRALRQGAVWYYRHGKPAAEVAWAQVRAQAQSRLVRAARHPAVRFLKGGVQSSGFLPAALFVQSLCKKIRAGVSDARR